jgi:hypothetical protein
MGSAVRHTAIQLASRWDKPSGISLFCTRCNPTILSASFRKTDVDACRNSREWMLFGLDTIFCPLAQNIVSFTPVPAVTVTWTHIAIQPSSTSAQKSDGLPSAYITWPYPHPNHCHSTDGDRIFFWHPGTHSRQHSVINENRKKYNLMTHSHANLKVCVEGESNLCLGRQAL